MTDQIQEIKEWFERAVPEPTTRSKSVQLGCHFEELSEMSASIGMEDIAEHLSAIGDDFKYGAPPDVIDGADKNALLDSLCDQIVTAIGVAHMFGFDIGGALAEVNRSNWSKFENGQPVFNEQGKIKKGKDYTPPSLENFINEQKA